MYDILLEISINIISTFLGTDLKEIKRSLNRKTTQNTDSISESIESVNIQLQKSKDIIDTALFEIEKQKKEFEELKKEAEISKQISEMNSEQVSALNHLLEGTLNKQEKKALPKNILFNLFFCILSAVIGFLLGKYL